MRSLRGFTLIELMIVIAIIAIIAAIAIPNLLAARKASNEASALSALKTISTAEAIFRESDREKDGNLDYGMLSELQTFDLLDTVLGQGMGLGLTITRNTLEHMARRFASCSPRGALRQPSKSSFQREEVS